MTIEGPSLDDLLRDIEDPSYKVRSRAIACLGRCGDGRAVEPLIRALGDRTARVRSRAIVALGRIGDERAIDRLVTQLQDEHPYVYRAAMGALLEFGKAAVPSLERALLDEGQPVRWLAVYLLKVMDGTGPSLSRLEVAGAMKGMEDRTN